MKKNKAPRRAARPRGGDPTSHFVVWHACEPYAKWAFAARAREMSFLAAGAVLAPFGATNPARKAPHRSMS